MIVPARITQPQQKLFSRAHVITDLAIHFFCSIWTLCEWLLLNHCAFILILHHASLLFSEIEAHQNFQSQVGSHYWEYVEWLLQLLLASFEKLPFLLLVGAHHRQILVEAKEAVLEFQLLLSLVRLLVPVVKLILLAAFGPLSEELRDHVCYH